VYRFKATTPAPGVPPIFYLYGGPSFEGLEPLLARKGYYEQRLHPLREAADLIIVSQRGIGPSKPTTLVQVAPPAPLDRAESLDARTAAIRTAAEREKQFWVDRGLDLEGFTIRGGRRHRRRAEGARLRTITIWGGSFGSHWGMAVCGSTRRSLRGRSCAAWKGPTTRDMPSACYSLERLARKPTRRRHCAGSFRRAAWSRIPAVIAKTRSSRGRRGEDPRASPCASGRRGADSPRATPRRRRRGRACAHGRPT
jgi:hypothetical protein